jgi:nitrate reductase NapE
LEGESVKRTERRAFIFLVVFLGPILAVAIVGGYGLAVWMSQLLFGLPGG